MKKRILSMLLAIVMVVGLVPGFAVTANAAPGDSFSSSVTDSTPNNGVALTKSVSYDPGTGKITTTVEAYTTGTVKLTNVTKPTDIVLVLDVSGSMAWSFAGKEDNSGERLKALKSTISSFIDQTAAQNAGLAEADMHSIAIVSFASDSDVVAGFTAVSTANAATLKSAVNRLTANGATAVDYGLTEAANLLNARAQANNGAYAEREKVVIVFTDGDPTHGSDYSAKVAHDAVNDAQIIKSTGAKIYTVGIFTGANPAGTDQSNVFMNYVSSNYPNAYGSYEQTGWLIFPLYSYVLYPGVEPYPVNTGYYKTASDAASLNNIFETISSQIGNPDIELGNSTTLIDVVSDYFIIEGIGTANPTIHAYTADYLGNDQWTEPVHVPVDSPIQPVLTGNDTIAINGFDFDNNYISENARENNFKGKKLILSFVTAPDYAKIDAADLTSAKIPTNDTAALLDSEGTAVEYVTSPALSANTVTYQIVENGVPRTVASYYRLPGAAVTLLNKPADTSTYTYGDWVPTGATLTGNAFTMPQNDVVLTSTASLQNYTVTYTFRGNVPAGAASDSPLNTAETYAVGATVTHPGVTVPAGYTFSGWVEDDNDIEAGISSFTMPADHLHFIGTFSALDNSYTVEHYLMDENGTYSNVPDHKNEYTGVKTGDSVTATIPNHTGYYYDVTTTRDAADDDSNVTMTTVDGVSVPGGSVLANGALTLKVYYARNPHKVSYVYEGEIPAGVTPPTLPYGDTAEPHLYGETVDLIDVFPPADYEFSGWRVYTGDTSVAADNTMVMPDSDVILHGSFIKTGNIPYQIEHYFQYLDDQGNLQYPTIASSVSDKTGDLGYHVYAEPLSDAELIGHSYDPEDTAQYGKVEGDITGDPVLTLKLYYSLAEHTVSYELTGAVPAGITAPASETWYFGEKVEITAPFSIPGYEFVGWNITGTGINDIIPNTSFIMPARDVVLTGHFNRIAATYKVEHYLEDGEGKYPETTPYFTVYSDDVYALQSVTGVPNAYNTYEYSVDVTKANNRDLTVDTNGVTGVVLADGSLVLKLYYTRKAYSITYQFENNPGNITVPTDNNTYKHGTVVSPLAALEKLPAGYTFDGWYHGTAKVGNSLTMPRENVTLVGRFTANTNTPYKIEYYQQKAPTAAYTPGTDPLVDYVLVEEIPNQEIPNLTGTTGAYVAAPSRTYTGFSFNSTNSVWNGHIAGDGSLTLKLYYDRNAYTVSYHYFGTPPAGVTVSQNGSPLAAFDPISTATVLYGAEVQIDAGLTASDDSYEFRGWYTANLPNIALPSEEIAPGTTFTMPARNVEFRGALYNYTVYYDLDGGTLNGADTIDPKQVNWNDADLLPAGTPVKDGLIFSGWRYAENESYATAADKYSDLAATPDVQVIVLKAEYATGYTVSYNWGTENIPDGVTLPVDTNLYADGASYTVDATYTNGYTVEKKDSLNNVVGVYTFTGWTDPSVGTINGASVVVTGSWTYTPQNVSTWTVTYEWTDAPDSETKPATVTGLVNGTLYTVDTTYTAATRIPVRDLFNNIIGYWYFSGWEPSGTFAVVENVTVRGTWTYEMTGIPPVIPTGSAELTKVDADDHTKVLPGVVFELHSSTGKHQGTYTTDANGKIKISGLSAGDYFWLEVRSAEGYVLNNAPHPFSVSLWNTASVIVENEKSPVPPAFGGDHYAYIIGYTDGLVHPEASITRAEVATIFFRLLSDATRAQYMTRENSFSDVNDGDWYNTAVSTMAAMGIVTGRPGGIYDPDANITRAEFAAIAARFDEHGNTTNASFSDIYDHWAQKEINIAANNGWVLGYEDGTFKPDQYITRAEAMTMVNRVLQRIPESADDLHPDMIIWPDNMDTTKWYYLMVQEATNSHYYARKVNGYEYWIELREVPDWAAYEK